MARTITLRDKLKEIIRAYKRINNQKFLYNKPGDLRRKFKRIRVWWLINSEDVGYSVMKMEFKRKEPLTVLEWTALFHTKVKGYEPIFNIFTQAVLPAINNKGGNAWTFKSLLAWTGAEVMPTQKNSERVREFAFGDSRQTQNSATSKRRNKTAKKRNANARNRNRR